jgi:hypothetical protein
MEFETMTDKRKKPLEQAVEADVEQAATPVEGEALSMNLPNRWWTMNWSRWARL